MIDTTNKIEMKLYFRFLLGLVVLAMLMFNNSNIFQLILLSTITVYWIFRFRKQKKLKVEKGDIYSNVRVKHELDTVVNEELFELGRLYKLNNTYITKSNEDNKMVYNIYLDSSIKKLSPYDRLELTDWLLNTRKKLLTNDYKYRLIVNGKPIKLAFRK